MKKGDLRKEAFLDRVEELLLSRGYDDVGLEDILDELDVTKGSFYYYFPTKLACLREICKRRAGSEIEELKKELSRPEMSPENKVSRILGMMLFSASGAAALRSLNVMAFRIGYRDDDANFREQNKQFLIENLLPLMKDAVQEGLRSGTFFSRYPGTLAEMILMLGCEINDGVCRIVQKNMDNLDCATEVVELVSAYRDSVELLLGAVFGSISIVNIDALMSFLHAVINRSDEG